MKRKISLMIIASLKKQAEQIISSCSSRTEKVQTRSWSNEELAQTIDHTLLKPEATIAQIEKICLEAIEQKFFSVCLNTGALPIAVEKLQDSKVKPICVVGFPLGACSTDTKIFETSWAIQNGAREIDMVLNVGRLKSDALSEVFHDISSVCKAAGETPVKVIIETSLLNQSEKVLACLLSKEAGASFVKTSTGFSSGGATVDDIRLMRAAVGDQMGVKASGGIKTREQAIELLNAGATRLGTSNGVGILNGTSTVTGVY